MTWLLILMAMVAFCHAECVRMTVAMPCSLPENRGMACTLVGPLCSSWFSQNDEFAYQRFMKRMYDMETDMFIDLSEGAIYMITPQSIVHGLNYKVKRVTGERLRILCGWAEMDGEEEFANTMMDLLDAKIAENVQVFYNNENAHQDADLSTSLLYVRTVTMTGFYVRRDSGTVATVPDVWQNIFRERHGVEQSLIETHL